MLPTIKLGNWHVKIKIKRELKVLIGTNGSAEEMKRGQFHTAFKTLVIPVRTFRAPARKVRQVRTCIVTGGVVMTETLKIDGSEFNRELLEMAAAFIHEVSTCMSSNDENVLEIIQLCGLLLSRIKSVDELPLIVRFANDFCAELLEPDHDSSSVIDFNKRIPPGTLVSYLDEIDDEFYIGRTISPAMKSVDMMARVLVDGCCVAVKVSNVKPCSPFVCDMMQKGGC